MFWISSLCTWRLTGCHPPQPIPSENKIEMIETHILALPWVYVMGVKAKYLGCALDFMSSWCDGRARVTYSHPPTCGYTYKSQCFYLFVYMKLHMKTIFSESLWCDVDVVHVPSSRGKRCRTKMRCCYKATLTPQRRRVFSDEHKHVHFKVP